jgi:hypothetical protein
MHAEDPSHGVRYELFLGDHDATRARYDAVVHTAAGARRASVEIDREGARVLEAEEGIDAAHQAQLLALARTVGRRDDAPWPRRLNRWRSPGVR